MDQTQWRQMPNICSACRQPLRGDFVLVGLLGGTITKFICAPCEERRKDSKLKRKSIVAIDDFTGGE